MQRNNYKYKKMAHTNTTTTTIATEDENLFLQVAEAFSKMGITMDNWTSQKYEGLMDAYSRNGRLTEPQKKLLISLPEKVVQYQQNAPASASKFKMQESPKTKLEPLANPNDMFSKYQPEMAKWVLDFDAKMRTAWIPTKDEIFQYGHFMRCLGAHYSPPNRWAKEFEEYSSNNSGFDIRKFLAS
jgi:hypothetical protein